MPGSGKSIARIIPVVAASVIVCLICASMALAKRDAGTYPSNVWAGEVSIGNMTRTEAMAALDKQNRASNSIDFKLPDKNLSIPLQDLGIEYDNKATLDTVDQSLYQGKGIGVLLQHSVIRGERQEIAPVLRWDARVLKDKILSLKNENDKPALDARILYSNNYLEYISHRNGYIIDAEQSMEKISQALHNGRLADLSLSVQSTYPRVRLDDIKEVKDVIGLTIIALPGSINQYRDSIRAINGLIVMPEDVIDLPVLITDSSSGIIAEAVKKACSQGGLNDENQIIINKLGHPILVTAVTDDNSLIIRIFGCQTEPGKNIEFSQEKREIMPDVKEIVNRRLAPTDRVVKQKGTSGYSERKYRIVKVNDKVIEKTLLSEEIYPPTDTIIMVGPGEIKK